MDKQFYQSAKVIYNALCNGSPFPRNRTIIVIKCVTKSIIKQYKYSFIYGNAHGYCRSCRKRLDFAGCCMEPMENLILLAAQVITVDRFERIHV